MSRPQVGNRVWGKSKKHAGKRGVVLQVLKESRQYTYEVKWSTGVVDIVAARSIALESDETCPPDPASGSGSNDISFLGLLGSSTSSLEADCWSSSSSSDDEEDNEDEVAESDHSDGGDDEIVVAHGRQWVSCDPILVDQAAHIPPRSTRLLWPPYLQIGDCSLVKYFYLMYPMSTVNETIRLTNIHLGRNSFRHIGQSKAMYALCWADRKHKMLISNRGTSLSGTDSVRGRESIETVSRNQLMLSNLSLSFPSMQARAKRVDECSGCAVYAKLSAPTTALRAPSPI
ncbi:hypothetical protein PHYPSEUDO_006179 [Phytophthora pseudosyringae]|uniref:PiggyBac transposable element-derived protein domain-containing protein n=1 Tax=Phytophthora pseudosyringae TaxID=221518 RepID=A0A8T1VPL2_9STRA|nr:hypothetical protein PHYPSEUDO_006179 [Phytophthora pseudosyringae]